MRGGVDVKSISGNAHIGSNVEIGEGVVIEDNVIIKDDVKIGHYTIIHENTEIGRGSFIGNHVILGERLAPFYNDPKSYQNPKLVLGEECIIRSKSVLYAGSRFGDNFQTGCHVSIRERNTFGKACMFGTMCQTECDVTVGDFTRMVNSVEIGKNAKIGSYVWIYAFALLADDLHPPCGRCQRTATIEDYAIIGPHSVIMPKLTIGRGALVGAHSLVTKDVPADVLVMGSPARIIQSTHDIQCKEKEARKHYPWIENIKDYKQKVSRYHYELNRTVGKRASGG